MKPTQELLAGHDAVLDALQLLEKVEAALAAQNQQARQNPGQMLDGLYGVP